MAARNGLVNLKGEFAYRGEKLAERGVGENLRILPLPQPKGEA